MKLNIIKCLMDLYYKYPSQTSAQPVYINLDCRSGRMWADWYGEIGICQPITVWNKLVLRWLIPSNCSAKLANELMKSIAKEARGLLKGFSERDGKGVFAEGSEELDMAISSKLEVDGDLHVWEVGDWLGSYEIQSKKKSEIPSEVKRLLKEAKQEDIYLDGDVEAYLNDRLLAMSVS